MGASCYWFARNKSIRSATIGGVRPTSRPAYHGLYATLLATVPAILVFAIWIGFEPYLIKHFLFGDSFAGDVNGLAFRFTEIVNLASGVLITEDATSNILAREYNQLLSISSTTRTLVFFGLLILGGLLGYLRSAPEFDARRRVEAAIKLFLLISSSIAVLTTVGIVTALIFESIRFFELVPVSEFLFGTKWSPQIAMHSDQVGSSGAFGAIPLFVGTFQIALLAMLIAVPIGLLSAIYLSEYASSSTRKIVKPLLEILAGIPTVVYGFFAALTVAPLVRDLGTGLGLETSSESALAAGVVMGFMIIPFVSSLSDDVINAVPQSLREASLGLGATQSETIKKVILPAALPGIAGSVLLAFSRAIGETMIVVMAAGLAANLTFNPLSNVTTVTVQIVTILVGDQEFDSAKTLAAFALGLVLFIVTLLLNILALGIVNKYREKYD